MFVLLVILKHIHVLVEKDDKCQPWPDICTTSASELPDWTPTQREHAFNLITIPVAIMKQETHQEMR